MEPRSAKRSVGAPGSAWSRPAWLALAAALMLLRVAPASATPVLLEVDYLTLSGESCIRVFCAPITPGGTFQKGFTLDSSLLAAPGS